MGIYTDNVNAGRTGWTFKYKGSELLAAATKLYSDFLSKEMAVRNQMSEYMKDMNISTNDPRMEDAKKKIQNFGSLREQCSVFKHEFARNPDHEYDLGLGDVTFFGLAPNEE